MIRQTELIVYGQILTTAQTVSQITATTLTAAYVDLYPDESITLKYSVADIKNVNGRNSTYSKQVKIPGTANNNNLFKQIFNIDSDAAFDPNKKAACAVLVNSIQVLSGYIQIIGIENNARPGIDSIDYDVVIYGSDFNFFKGLGEREITDLDFTGISYNFNKNEIKHSWTGNTDYVVPLIDYGFGWNEPYVQSTSGVTYDQMFPCVRVKSIWDRIFSPKNIQYKYKSKFIDSEFFKNLIVTPSTSLATAECIINVNYAITLPNTTTTASIGVMLWQIRNGTRYIPVGMENHIVYGPGSTSYSNSIQIKGQIEVLPGDKYEVVFQSDWTIDSSIKNTVAIDVALNTGSTWSMTYGGNINSNIFVGLTVPVNFTIPANTTGQRNVVFNDDSTFPFIDPGNTYNTTFGEHVPNLTFSNFLPQKIKQTEFITSLIQMFNLYIDVDKQDQTILIIEPRDDWYNLSNTVFDWTNKQDLSIPKEVRLLSEIQTKNILFSYKDDSDSLNSDYKTRTRQTYGSYNAELNNDFLVNTTNIQPLFSPTPLQNMGNNSEVIIPRIYSISIDSGMPVVSRTNFNTRILYYGGLLPITNSQNNWKLVYIGGTSETFSEYPYCGNLNNPINSTSDLNYGVTQSVYYHAQGSSGVTNNNLFNIYWKNYIEMISDKNSKLLTAYFNLKAYDIYRVRLNDKIFLENDYYYINSIEYDAIETHPSKVELLKINSLNTTPNFDFVSYAPVGTDNSQDNLHNIRTVNLAGFANTILTGAMNIGGNGNNNFFQGYISGATVYGENNTIQSGGDIFIRGNNNQLFQNTNRATIVNGDFNTGLTQGSFTILNGSGNTINSVVSGATQIGSVAIISGNDNYITPDSNYTGHSVFIGLSNYSGSPQANTLYAPNIILDSGGTINNVPVSAITSSNNLGSFGITIDGGSITPSTGSKGFITVPYSGTITSWYIVADQSGSCVIDIKRSGTSVIGGGNSPALSSAQRANAAVASWTSVDVSSNDEFEFSVTSASTLKRINLSVEVTKS